MRRLVLPLLIALAPGVAAAQSAGGQLRGTSSLGPLSSGNQSAGSPSPGDRTTVTSPSGNAPVGSQSSGLAVPGNQASGIPPAASPPAGNQPRGDLPPGSAQSTARRPPASKAAERAALLDALQAAPDETFAVHVETRLREMWLEAGSPAVTLLMSRGLRALNAGQSDDAIEAFTDALTLDPDLAAAYHQRALARFHAGDTQGAIRDIEETLKREPRDFAALRSLSEIAAAREDWKGAYAAWQKMLEIDPKTPGGDEKLRDLKRRAFGEEA